MRNQLLELKIEALERRIEALEDALISQSIIEVVPDPDPITAAPAEAGRDPNTAEPAEVFTDPNKAEAAAQYNKYTEEYKTIAEHIPDSVVKECIDKINTSFQFVYLQDVYRYYVQRCTAKNTTPIFQKYFLVAANRAGYPTYNYYSKKCLWISDKPKSKPGKRKRQPRK